MNNTFEWCGYHWRGDMNGRIIHEEHPYSWYSADGISEIGNTLSLNIFDNQKEVTYKGKTYKPRYEASVMRSVESFRYGTFSCEMKMPKGSGFTASFWLSGEKNWPPEIDINEGFVKKSWLTLKGWNTTNNIHYRNERMEHDHIRSKCVPLWKQCKNPTAHFIKYEVEWRPDIITFRANGKVTRVENSYICQQLTNNIERPEKGYQMNVIFNVWNHIGGTSVMEAPMMIRNFKYIPL